jgi:molybdate transport system substrate-binding protein
MTMKRQVILVRLALTKILWIAAFALLAAQSRAAEITFLAANALEPALKELLPEFQKLSGHTVTVSYGSLGVITDRVQKGEAIDLAIVAPPQWESLYNDHKVGDQTRRALARATLGVFVKKGAQRPDVSSVDTFKRALLSAPSVAFGDPDRGSPVGAYVMPMLVRLGIANDLKPKLRLPQGGPPVIQAVASGDAAIGLTQISEIVASPEVDLVAPFPPEIQNITTYVAAIPMAARAPMAAMELVEFLSSARGILVFKGKGLATS